MKKDTNNITNEKIVVTTELAEIKKVIRERYEKL